MKKNNIRDDEGYQADLWYDIMKDDMLYPIYLKGMEKI